MTAVTETKYNANKIQKYEKPKQIKLTYRGKLIENAQLLPSVPETFEFLTVA